MEGGGAVGGGRDGMNHHPDDDRVAELARWLIAEARLSLAPLELIDRFCRQLVEFGVPLWRLRAGQRLANPLASAWGVIWTRDGSDTHEYVVARTTSRPARTTAARFNTWSSAGRLSAAPRSGPRARP